MAVVTTMPSMGPIPSQAWPSRESAPERQGYDAKHFPQTIEALPFIHAIHPVFAWQPIGTEYSMEFLREVHHPGLDIKRLKSLLTIDNLTRLCASISTASPSSENEGDIYCIWGAFSLRRDEIRNGVRYALVNCPHALAWTVTYDEARQNLIIHCTIDKTRQDPDFIESIHEFVSDWSHGMTQALQE